MDKNMKRYSISLFREMQIKPPWDLKLNPLELLVYQRKKKKCVDQIMEKLEHLDILMLLVQRRHFENHVYTKTEIVTYLCQNRNSGTQVSLQKTFVLHSCVYTTNTVKKIFFLLS